MTVSKHLDAARKAIATKDDKKAATELRTVADDLKQQAARAGKADQALVQADKSLVAADTKAAKDTMKRMDASALKVSSAATAVESGKIKTEADLDKAIDKAARADMERRWLVTDVTTWYPVSEEPQRHFTDAVAAYAAKDYKAAAVDIRKATSYLRLEAGRAYRRRQTGTRQVDCATRRLAASVEKGAVKDEQTMTRRFCEGRPRARPGAPFQGGRIMGAQGVRQGRVRTQGGCPWAGKRRELDRREAKAGASATVADIRALGDKLAAGGAWTRDEVTKGFESLGNEHQCPGPEDRQHQEGITVQRSCLMPAPCALAISTH